MSVNVSQGEWDDDKVDMLTTSISFSLVQKPVVKGKGIIGRRSCSHRIGLVRGALIECG